MRGASRANIVSELLVILAEPVAALQTLVEDRLALVDAPHLHGIELEDAVAAIGALLFYRRARRLSFYRLFCAPGRPGRGCSWFCPCF